MSPLVSVLLPVKEYSAYLNDSIASILAQTLTDFECLVIGYADIENWSHKLPSDPRIKCLIRKEAGIVSALNTGIIAANGEYIARMDADDLSLPTRFADQLAYLKQNPNIQIAGAAIEFFVDSGGVQSGNQIYQQWLNSLVNPESIEKNLFVESPLPHPTLFTTRHCLKQLGGYRNVTWAEDYDLLLRAYIQGLKMGKPPEILFQWRDHSGRLSRTDRRYSKKNFLHAKAWAIAKTKAKNRQVTICGTGSNATGLHDSLLKFGVQVQSFVEVSGARTRTSKRQLPVISYEQLLKNKRDTLIVSAVSARGARDKLREYFCANNLTEGSDFVMAG